MSKGEKETDGQVIAYNVTNAALEELRERFAVVPEINNKKDYEVVRGALSEVRGLRTGVEKQRQVLKSDALAWGKKVDAEAKRITGVLEGIEAPFKAVKAKYDEAKEVERQAKLKAEEKRKDAITARINDIRKAPLLCEGMSPDDIMGEIDKLDALDIEAEGFEEFAEEAAEATTEAVNVLKSLHVNAVLRVQKEATQKKEEERLAKEREAFEEEKKKEDEKRRLENEEFEKKREEVRRAEERIKEADEKKRLAKEKKDEEKKAKALEKQNKNLQDAKRTATINAIDEVLQKGNAADVVEAIIANEIPNVRWTDE